MDAYYLIKKAQALLRMAKTTDDPAIADRMRELAAHCFNKAEQMNDDDLVSLPMPPFRRNH